jgi:polyisoprenoid-binding protein YceI
MLAQSIVEEEMTVSTIEQTRVVPVGTWNVDPVHSSVGFEVSYAAGTFGSEVPKFEATLEDGKLVGKADIRSLQVKDENFQAHLLSPEFFDAEEHAEIRFESAGEVQATGGNVEIPGEITIKGITQPTTLVGTVNGPITDAFGRERVGLRLQAVVDRTQFGITWNMALPSGEPALANDVTLKADLQLVAAEA